MKQFMLYLCVCWIIFISNLYTVVTDDYTAVNEELIAKVRHSRHSKSNDYFQLQTPSENRTNNNNHFPVFPRCSFYKPTVKEEQPTGTHVIVVEAIDPDPLKRGGTITYSFVADPQEQIKFHIDNQTGLITTRQILNRDEPVREKEIYLIVRATDNGKPQLDAFCKFTVTVEDINDNAPTFDRISYTESIPQDMEVGSTVMRISATDIDDGLNKEIEYGIQENTSSKFIKDRKYFFVNENTGIVTLNKKIDKDPGYTFKIKASATDKSPTNSQTSYVDLFINIIESNKKAPNFIGNPPHQIHLKENFKNLSDNIATFEAVSNTDETAPIFTLVTGISEQTNKMDTFDLRTAGNTAFLHLSSPSLDYERVKEYILTIRIENKYKLAAEHTLIIKVDDVNDLAPKFTKEVTSGSVLEDEPEGTPVMQVSAIDLDESPEFRQITYELQDNDDKFQIDKYTGNITTKVRFDREEKDVYNVKVLAKDGAPSANLNNGQPNMGEQVFRIFIADKNDHSPEFQYQSYSADVPENSDVNSVVMEVHAYDIDSASTITYSIVSGNERDAFYVEPETGRIKIKNRLDYESVTSYNLTLKADDGLYKHECEVHINVINVNDNAPVFREYNPNVTINEEELIPGCIVTLEAYDPDIRDRNAFQDIVYSVYKTEQQDFLSINSSGCLSLIQPLDRDPPTGYEQWQLIIKANDEGGPSKSSTSLFSTTEVLIRLIDKNDNAPFLKMPEPIIWQENQPPGRIIQLKADDYDGPGNGEPFTFEFATEASSIIRKKFAIIDSFLEAIDEFDREEQKQYIIPIAITDSGKPSCKGVSNLTIIIGDENDNPMKMGSSSVFVYYFENASHDVVIGRVYVDDPDDWDLMDKHFEWETYESELRKYFSLNQNTGMITMSKIPASSYLLKFKVTEDPKNRNFPAHSVSASVNVTVKEIPEDAVLNSGSIRFEGITAEEFISKDENGRSKADVLKSLLASALNNSEHNLDVFTILHSPVRNNSLILDVRFSSHGSPYYPSEKINVAVVKNQEEFEKMLKTKILMVNVDECLIEKAYCEASCSNHLIMKNASAPVFTNTTSFIGINAYVNYSCECVGEEAYCSNSGMLSQDGRCQCSNEVEDPHCEQTSIRFLGIGWALYPPFDACENTHISLYVRALKKDGLIFYVGPDSIYPSSLAIQDFIALEIRKGFPVLLIDYGTGTAMIEHNYSVVDDNFHKIDIHMNSTIIEMFVDDCKLQTCRNFAFPIGTNQYLNVNGPLQVGGTYMNLKQIGLHRSWSHKPTSFGFHGCIQNFTVNGKSYNLNHPSVAQNAESGCSEWNPEKVVFGFNWTFLIALAICLVILTILLMAVVVHRRKVEDMYRDTDDIRENIINYEDEGGGEGDMTGYDLNVLRLHYNGPFDQNQKYLNGILLQNGENEVPDICGFLDNKKQSVDNDPETLPFDNVRQYAYEGDGNTTGSLSSLASGTDEGDLNFDYLSNFGPRFRKLADMYGEDASDEDSDTYHNATSESWC